MKSKLNLTYLTFMSGPLPDPHVMASGDKLKDIHPQPGICKLLHSLEDLNLVDCAILCPPEISTDIIKHPGETEFPQLPVDGYYFKFPIDFEQNYKQQCHLESLKLSQEISATIEEETRQQSQCQLWTQVRKLRLIANRFHEICHVRRESSIKALAACIMHNETTGTMKRGLDLEPEILRQYSDFSDVSVTQCGIIIHSDAPHLGASPDAKVFNPGETPPFGLAQVKSCDVENVAQVKQLITVKGQACLKKSHKYYYHVQSQLRLSGLQWCDFIR
ncbi:hypothetical protein N1851_003540 [Merluccius polli]|uniref:YqaJ viral recombinase domain-containing protein n=1 Tax=Merluccius polli TaxID=89951 RepID=A0AA47P7V0_MERPO|nr:hypothetical protein N1851_003540 [Merluccius polli]